MSFLSLLSLLSVLLQSTSTLADTFPATLELDLLFPLNTTYAPTTLFPIVFALQNAPLFPLFDPQFDFQIWDITHGNGLNATSYAPVLDLSTTNFTVAETIFVYTYVHLPVGSYSLVWGFAITNCSEGEAGEPLGFVHSGGSRGYGVQFTVQDGAQVVDLAAPLTSDQCAGLEHFSFNVTGTLEVPEPAEDDGLDTCAVLDEQMPLVEGNPCAVSVGTAAASSIEAQITKTECGRISPLTGISCAPSATTTKKSDAGGRYEGGGGVGGMGMGMVVLGGLMAGFL